MTHLISMVIPALILVALTASLFALARTARQAGQGTKPTAEVWVAARTSDDSQLGRLLLSVAQPVSVVVDLDPRTNTYKALETKLAATGTGLFAGSVEVFVSVQVAAILISTGALAIIPLLRLTGMSLLLAVLMAGAVAAFPYNRVHELAGKRLAAVREELPEFAELLLMPVTSGYSIIPALDFTASRMHGVVADQVRTMLGLLASRAGSEAAIFEMTGQRLADPAAVTFFNTLYQSYTGGVKVADIIRAQAEQLRNQEHQRKRAQLKKLPNKLVFIIALHLLPFLFVVAFLPTLFAMGSM